MRIGVDARSAIGQNPRGEGKTLLQLYREIARLRPAWELCFFGQTPAAAPEHAASALKAAVPGAQVRCFDLPGFRWNTWENLGLPWMAARHRLDLLHCFSSGGPAWLSTPMVMTVHDIIPLIIDDGQSASEIERFRRRLKSGLRSARQVVAVSGHTRQDILNAFPSTDAHKLSVVHWGGPAVDPQVIAGRTAHHGALAQPGPVLAFGGGGAKRKNVPGVVRMFRRVVDALPQARLQMIGVTHSGERAAVLALVQSLGLQDHVQIDGFISEPALAQAYLDASCLVYISTYEGFGLPPLEAMARGVPVVASTAASIPEVVGQAGVLVDPLDDQAVATAVIALLGDPARCAELSDLGAQRAANFTWQGCAEAMIEVFETVARQRL